MTKGAYGWEDGRIGGRTDGRTDNQQQQRTKCQPTTTNRSDDNGDRNTATATHVCEPPRACPRLLLCYSDYYEGEDENLKMKGEPTVAVSGLTMMVCVSFVVLLLLFVCWWDFCFFTAL